jgi:hypothetical protein
MSIGLIVILVTPDALTGFIIASAGLFTLAVCILRKG